MHVPDGCPAGDEDEHAAVGEVGLELAPGGGGRGVVRGEHRAGTGLFQVAADRRFEGGGFLNQPGDFATGEKFFEMRDELEVEPPGNDQAAGGWKTFFVNDLNGSEDI